MPYRALPNRVAVLRPGMNADRVLLYTSPGCPDCAAVRDYLKAHGVAYEERSIAVPGVAEEAKARYGVRVAPITVIGGKPLWGTFAQQKPLLDGWLQGGAR